MNTIPASMRVPRFVGDKRIEFGEKPVPRPGEGELLIKVRANFAARFSSPASIPPKIASAFASAASSSVSVISGERSVMRFRSSSGIPPRSRMVMGSVGVSAVARTVVAFAEALCGDAAKPSPAAPAAPNNPLRVMEDERSVPFGFVGMPVDDNGNRFEGRHSPVRRSVTVYIASASRSSSLILASSNAGIAPRPFRTWVRIKNFGAGLLFSAGPSPAPPPG